MVKNSKITPPTIQPLPGGIDLTKKPDNDVKKGLSIFSLPNELLRDIGKFSGVIYPSMASGHHLDVVHPMNEFIKAFPNFGPVMSSIYTNYNIVAKLESPLSVQSHFHMNHPPEFEGDFPTTSNHFTVPFCTPSFSFKSGLDILHGNVHSAKTLALNSNWAGIMSHYSSIPFPNILSTSHSSFRFPRRVCLHTVIPCFDSQDTGATIHLGSLRCLVCHKSFLSDYWLFAYPFTYTYYSKVLRPQKLALLDGLGVNIIKEGIENFGEYLRSYFKITADQLHILNKKVRLYPNSEEELSNVKDIGFFEGITRIEFQRDITSKQVSLNLIEPLPLNILKAAFSGMYGTVNHGSEMDYCLLDNKKFPLGASLEKFNHSSITGPVSIIFKRNAFTDCDLELVLDEGLADPYLREQTPYSEEGEGFIKVEFQKLTDIVQDMNLMILLINYKLKFLEEIERNFQFYKNPPGDNDMAMNDYSNCIRQHRARLSTAVDEVIQSNYGKICSILSQDFDNLGSLQLRIGHNDSLKMLYDCEIENLLRFREFVYNDTVKYSGATLDFCRSQVGFPDTSLDDTPLGSGSQFINKRKRKNSADCNVSSGLSRSVEYLDDERRKWEEPSEVDLILRYDWEKYMNLNHQRSFLLSHYQTIYNTVNECIPFLSESEIDGGIYVLAKHGQTDFILLKDFANKLKIF
ncbi:hypothetical protein WICPIJ_006464 [Wickerhamomyces pijperi]|uniref:Uncharacterized protein n=1 Tax=Wickerhamomyces pijperi TaxID=599730 RepID=A0A9P8Q281_WICPI|nr:hypothetical protein WICPIJ_006464 [Wickerhamomyces pijperi]